MSRPIYVGTRPKGTRVHFTTRSGFSQCGRHCIDVKPLEQMDTRGDVPWCATCLTRITEDEISLAFIAERRRRQLPNVLDRTEQALRALHIAVEALTEIAKLGDDPEARPDLDTGVALARGLALEAAAEIGRTFESAGGDA